MIALANDHGGFELMREIRSYLDDRGYKYKYFGEDSTDSSDYPKLAVLAANAIISGECERGILVCGTGIGMSITANKIPGIRAAHCADCFSAEMTRRHNDANVLALGGRVTGSGHALMIVEVFLNIEFEDNSRHSKRVEMINALDEDRG